MTTQIFLIAAVALNGTIGRDAQLPWTLKADLRFFKATTMGYPIIMGRKTWSSLGRALPGRRNIVISRQTDYLAPGAEVVHSLAAALAAVGNSERTFVIGGGDIYRQFLPLADTLLITEVQTKVEGDTLFPVIDLQTFIETERKAYPADEENEFAYDFVCYRRSEPNA